jgi:hypothetical protein
MHCPLIQCVVLCVDVCDPTQLSQSMATGGSGLRLSQPPTTATATATATDGFSLSQPNCSQPLAASQESVKCTPDQPVAARTDAELAEELEAARHHSHHHHHNHQTHMMPAPPSLLPPASAAVHCQPPAPKKMKVESTHHSSHPHSHALNHHSLPPGAESPAPAPRHHSVLAHAHQSMPPPVSAAALAQYRVPETVSNPFLPAPTTKTGRFVL